MSLVPLLFSHWWEDLDRPHHVHDQHFGLGLHQDQLLSPRHMEAYVQPHERYLTHYVRPWTEILQSNKKRGMSTVEADKDKFQVTLDVQQFRPEEIDVKVVDKYIVITAKHEEKPDEHGWISREFTRKYLVPEQCDVDQVQSKLSVDGVLTITAPRKDKPQAKNERVIKIEHTGKPAIKPKETENKKVEDKK